MGVHRLRFELLEDRLLLALVPFGLLPGDQYYLAFVTSQQVAANMGGVAGADFIVDQIGDLANPSITGPGTYRAILSDSVSGQNAVQTMQPGIPIFNTNGDLVANNVGSLFAGAATQLQAPISYDENGVLRNLEVWTGTNASGTVSQDASGWTNANGTATLGFSAHTDSRWIDNGATTSFSSALYGVSTILTVPQFPGEIHGQKWHDLDGDGVRDPNEPGLDGWVIEVGPGPGTVLASDITHSVDLNRDGQIDPITERGLYWIQNVPPGIWEVSEVLQPGWTQSFPASPQTYSVTVASNAITGIDFGNFQSSSLHGQKWNDLNGDGIKDPNEPGIDGWPIEVLDPNTGAVVATQLTHSVDLNNDNTIDPFTEQGLYWIDGLPAGTYFIGEGRNLTTPNSSGWHQTYPNRSIQVSGHARADNFTQAFTGNVDGSSLTEIGPVITGPQGPFLTACAVNSGSGTDIVTATTTTSPPVVTNDDYLYFSAWSDDGTAQGFLANLLIDGQGVNSGDPGWQVLPTGVNRGGCFLPGFGLDSVVTKAELANQLATAQAISWVCLL